MCIDTNVVELPCKPGQKVFWVTTECNEDAEEVLTIYEGEVVSFSIQKEGLWAYCKYNNGLTYWHVVGNYFGIEVFTAKEAAEKKLKYFITGNMGVYNI
jgi:hypothetical protein